MNTYSPYQVDLEELLLTKEDWDVFASKFIELPVSTKDIMVSDTTASYLKNLSEKLGLDQNQSSDLSRIVRDVLLADAFLGDFPVSISSQLGVDMNTANQIAQKVVSELFAPALEDIKNIQREKFKDRIAQNRSNQSQQSPQNTNTEQGNVIDLRKKSQ